MKKLLTLTLLLATLLTFSACDDKNEPETNPFVGKWICTISYDYSSNNKLKIVHELTIKKDYTAEQMIKQYINGQFSSWNMNLYTYTIDDTKENKIIYLNYSTENEGYNPAYNYVSQKGIISNDELIIVDLEKDELGNYVDGLKYYDFIRQ